MPAISPPQTITSAPVQTAVGKRIWSGPYGAAAVQVFPIGGTSTPMPPVLEPSTLFTGFTVTLTEIASGLPLAGWPFLVQVPLIPTVPVYKPAGSFVAADGPTTS